MILMSWNVQWCRGVDGRVDAGRIARVARELADFDLLCLQEVAVNFPGLAGSRGEDQVAELSAGLIGYTPLWGPATDVNREDGSRSLFGNMIFSRLPVLQVFRHSLPWPSDPGVPSMQRMALEAIVQTSLGALRIISTHLEYFSNPQRLAQVEALRALHVEACAHALALRPDYGQPGGCFTPRPRPASAIISGDFNFKPEAPEHARMLAPFETGQISYVDVWQKARPGQPHEPTVGLFQQESGGPYCCDFVFATRDLIPHIETISIDPTTQASDHQPVIVHWRDR